MTSSSVKRTMTSLKVAFFVIVTLLVRQAEFDRCNVNSEEEIDVIVNLKGADMVALSFENSENETVDSIKFERNCYYPICFPINAFYTYIYHPQDSRRYKVLFMDFLKVEKLILWLDVSSGHLTLRLKDQWKDIGSAPSGQLRDVTRVVRSDTGDRYQCTKVTDSCEFKSGQNLEVTVNLSEPSEVSLNLMDGNGGAVYSLHFERVCVPGTNCYSQGGFRTKVRLSGRDDEKTVDLEKDVLKEASMILQLEELLGDLGLRLNREVLPLVKLATASSHLRKVARVFRSDKERSFNCYTQVIDSCDFKSETKLEVIVNLSKPSKVSLNLTDGNGGAVYSLHFERVCAPGTNCYSQGGFLTKVRLSGRDDEMTVDLEKDVLKEASMILQLEELLGDLGLRLNREVLPLVKLSIASNRLRNVARVFRSDKKRSFNCHTQSPGESSKSHEEQRLEVVVGATAGAIFVVSGIVVAVLVCLWQRRARYHTTDDSTEMISVHLESYVTENDIYDMIANVTEAQDTENDIYEMSADVIHAHVTENDIYGMTPYLVTQ